MKKIKWPIIVVTAYVFFYQLSPYFGISDRIIITMFAISPIAVMWMAYKILKNGIPSQRTFDEYFYEAPDYKRNNISEV